MRSAARAAFVAVTALSAFAQAPAGGIAGVVSDPSGAVIVNATITAVEKTTGLKRTAETGEDGVYTIPALPAGTFSVRAEMAGFRNTVRDAVVQTGAETRVDFTMEVGSTSETITVEAAAAQITYESYRVDGVINRQQIQSLPLNGRNFLQLAVLEPGVTVSVDNLGQYNKQFNVSVLGSSGDRTRVTVDGSNVSDFINGGTAQNFSQEVVQEFQLSSVNFDLSTGTTAAGAVNIVTRTGGNDFHGSGYFFFRDHNMAAYPGLRRDPRNPDPFFARRQSGAWIGGPIKKDRTFFFYNIEHNNQDGVFNVQPNSADFAQFGGIFPSDYTATQHSVRLDHRISANNQAFLRYSHDGNNGFSPRNAAALPSNWVQNKNWADQASLGLTTTAGAKFVNDLRLAFTYWSNKNITAPPDKCAGGACIGLGMPQIEVVGTGFIIGNTTNAPQSRALRRYSIFNTSNWQQGAHRMKFGSEIELQIGRGTFAFLEPAAMVLYSPDIVRSYNAQLPPALRLPLPAQFKTIQDVLALPLVGFQTGIGEVIQPPRWNAGNADHNYRIRFFWQDTYRIAPRLTLNFGLAYNLETNVLNHDLPKPEYLRPIFGYALNPSNVDRANWSPALGFAWQPTKDQKTVVQAGFGIYYDTQPLELRLIERGVLGPRGNGRFPIPGSIVPNPVPGIPGVPPGTPINFPNNPTFFSGAILMQILNPVRQALRVQLGPPDNTDLTLRNINTFKSGSEIFDPNFQLPQAYHFNAGVQREIAHDLVVRVDFVNRQSIKELMRNVDYNHWNSVTVGPRIRPCRGAAEQSNPLTNCAVDEVAVHTSSGRSYYRGMLVKVDKRYSRRFMLTGGYSLQWRGGWNGIIDKDDWFASWGPQGPRNIFNVSGVFDLPWNFQVSFISVFSGRSPFMPVIPGIDLKGSGVGSTPLPGVPYNAFNVSLSESDLPKYVDAFNQQYAGKVTPRGQPIPAITLPRTYQMGDLFSSQDVRVTKAFTWRERYRVDVFGEVFNLFNTANVGGFSSNLRDAAFGQASTRTSQVFGSGGPRAFQVGSRFTF